MHELFIKSAIKTV